MAVAESSVRGSSDVEVVRRRHLRRGIEEWRNENERVRRERNQSKGMVWAFNRKSDERLRHGFKRRWQGTRRKTTQRVFIIGVMKKGSQGKNRVDQCGELNPGRDQHIRCFSQNDPGSPYGSTVAFPGTIAATPRQSQSTSSPTRPKDKNSHKPLSSRFPTPAPPTR